MNPLTFERVAYFLDGTVMTPNNGDPVSKIVAKSGLTVPACVLLVHRKEIDARLFVPKLQTKKVGGIVVVKPSQDLIKMCSQAGIGVIRVEKRRKTLCRSAELQRLQYSIPFVQVIGSSGKTTTKEMIAAILQDKMPIVKTSKNYNAPTEVAKKILNVNEQHGAAVLEAGMTAPYMMRLSSNMIKPDIAVVTSIHRAHLMRFGSMENIISAKAQVLRYLPDHGTLIINGEDKNCEKFLQQYHGTNAMKFGFSNKSDIWASDIKYAGEWTSFTVRTKAITAKCLLNTFGDYNVLNALAAISVGLKLGLDIRDIVSGLAKFRPVKNRLEVLEGIQGTTIVNDNYNANPDSTKSFLDNVPAFAQGRPVILVMGDMENPRDEIREYAEKAHFWIGMQAAKIPFQHMIAVGKWAEQYINGALYAGVNKRKLHYFRYLHNAQDVLPQLIVPNSVIVFKSSPYMKVRTLIPAIKKLTLNS